LPATIASAFAAASDPEVIVVDDASTDATEMVCRNTPNIVYLRLPRQGGSSEARNAGIGSSRCAFVAFLDDDDLRLPGSIDAQLAALEAAPNSAFIYGRAFLGDSRYSLPTGWVVPPHGHSGDVFWRLLEANFVQMPTVVARRDVLVECGMFDPTLQMLEDYDLWIRIAEKYRIEYFPEPVAVIRKRSDTSGQKTSDRAEHERLHKALHRRWLTSERALAESPRFRRRVHKRHMEIIYDSLIHDAAVSLLEGRVGSARAFLRAAARISPLHPKAHGSLLWLHLRKNYLRYGETRRLPPADLTGWRDAA